MTQQLRPSWALLLVCLAPFISPGLTRAGGISFLFSMGAPPGPNWQDFDESGRLYPPGYSPGYGYYDYYKHLPSLVITNQQTHDLPAVVVPPSDGVPPTAALVRVRVPADAEIWFSGVKTTQRGTERLFVTRPMADGQPFVYEVLARWTQDGRPVERKRQLVLHADDRVTVDFGVEPDGTLPAPRKLELQP